MRLWLNIATCKQLECQTVGARVNAQSSDALTQHQKLQVFPITPPAPPSQHTCHQIILAILSLVSLNSYTCNHHIGISRFQQCPEN